MFVNPYVPQPAYPYYTYTPGGEVSGPTPVYALLIIGMVFFMASNVMPNLIPPADRVWHTAPFLLQWGFLIIICALLVQMMGLLPGVPQIHITYVHMTIAVLLFVIMWNQTVPGPSPPPPEEKKSSSSSKDKPAEAKKEEKKKEEPKPEEPSPWDDLRAHPSAFLTTRLNKMMPWPFPMGKASSGGKELWWEKGMPAHVGHFNRPEQPAPKKDADEDAKKKKKEEEEKQKAKEQEELKQKEAEKSKEKEKAMEKEKAAKEAAAKAKAKEDEAKRAKELEKAKEERARQQAVEDKQRQKLWRTKYLVMIIGISFLNRSLAFLLLLCLCLQMVSQEINKTVPSASSPPAAAPASTSSSSTSSQAPSSSGAPSKPPSAPSADAEKEKMAKMKAMKEKEAADKAKSSSASSAKPSSSSSSAKPSSSSSSSSNSKTSSSSSSKPKDAPVSSDAIRKASGSTTVTKVDPGEDSSIGVPYTVGFGMNYIFNPDTKGETLESPSMPIPSTGMSHPLMTTYRQYAN
ncbi:hypothetical protein L198_01870 [Cryptococcus wingfieldii CBS 7118]|uniref:Uncharacterized protein n=1 Tax=Cryptococcus wingfieldii CBS 7118 TaxID=1295528 RepID=A0A1E3JWD9_9TREE|nr:hypothetical protein L198_01870 [Cryptococcus wingfieldii CBS 7118]ODO05181.1 hypothetical protein L198_01870 [Cryptococcus wingfieldii CBS 7118]